ncbi:MULTISPECIES: hypothetical protein [unclassified Streptomyces]|uniref:hypothetical protein n=1 Tax=unclassified Streptomyces TaxID=2593676 RepID=UPI00202DCBCB|nr:MULTISPECIES: hypothetical protein [unclassified Streptomyces]MCM1970635.1 hypothetical protein [Streptomyces sp. G1]MCX5130444.1 hypothetical protein [Streptomyces sp. NBC_00347]MCX5301825.1 hypothetical protein [Streptomyces sp. NBC_00193]
MSVPWVRLELTVRTFDSARFTPYVDRCRAEGFSFTTLARLGDAEDARRRLYELNKECSADIPERGARGRGISLAMKTLGIAFADHHAAPVIRTMHHPANTSAIAMNRTLGYVDADWHRETP